MITLWARRVVPVAVTAGIFAATAAPVAAAPPVADPALLPAAGAPAPPDATEQRVLCAQVAPAEDGPRIPFAQRILDFASVWPLTRGEGQVVAVIDTGVSPHPRLPDVVPQGDYVSDGDGTDDCDAHGTIVAGLIAARPVDGSGFAGGAPAAQIMTIRQSSRHYGARGVADDPIAPTSTGYGNVRTLAAAVRRAADEGATVVNISQVACVLAGGDIGDGALGAAVRYAVEVHDVVVVAAAGNKDSCPAWNPGSRDPLDPYGDPWDAVTTVASPAWFDEYVLTVGSVESDGAPSEYSLPGPWVDVAAPGSAIVSLDPGSDGLADGYRGSDGTVPFHGTSFAAPLVSATVALVRARHPDLDARAVIDRIERTAHSPAEGWNPRVGHGVVDPVAAVGARLGPPASGAGEATRPVAGPSPVPEPDPLPRIVAWAGSAAVLAVLGSVGAVSVLVRGRGAPRNAHPPARTGAGRGSGSSPS